jgi:hypothetical protein
MLYKYRSESITPALVLFAVVGVIVVLLPANVRVIGALFFSGPVAWSILQLLRRGRGVTVTPGEVRLDSCLTRRTTTVPIDKVQAWRTNGRDQLLLAWHQERDQDDPDDPRPPRLRLFVTAALDDSPRLAAALPKLQPLPPEQMNMLIGIWRVRRGLMWIGGLFIGLPLVVFIIIRVLTAASAN